MLKCIKSKFKSTTDFVLVVGCAAALSGLLGMFLHESGQTAEDIFAFYGNIPTKDVFFSPETLASYTFGRSDGPIPMHFHNEMWCQPLGSEDAFIKIDERENEYDAFVFVNPLPDVAAKNEEEGLLWSDYGMDDRTQVREGGNKYLSWNWDAGLPDVSSTCYIDAILTTKTWLFGMDKAMFVPDVGRFIYIVPAE